MDIPSKEMTDMRIVTPAPFSFGWGKGGCIGDIITGEKIAPTGSSPHFWKEVK